MRVPEMYSDHRMFMFLYALMEMAASVANIICIAQITYEFVYYTLPPLINQQSVVYEFICDLCDTIFTFWVLQFSPQNEPCCRTIAFAN